MHRWGNPVGAILADPTSGPPVEKLRNAFSDAMGPAGVWPACSHRVAQLRPAQSPNSARCSSRIEAGNPHELTNIRMRSCLRERRIMTR